jgi:pimeloyl-ACP methyl ester carboxylesterase
MPADQIGTPSDIVVSEHDIRIAGHRLHYLRAGSGPAVVLVHGLLGYSFSWRFVIPYLAPHFTVYAPDLLGIGFSERVAGLDCSLRAHVDRMLEFCERLGLDSLDLVGTSHGGGLATMMAAMAAKRGRPQLRHLVLVAPVNPWSESGKQFTRFLATRAGGAMFIAIAPLLRTINRYWLGRMYGDPRRIPPGTVEGYSLPLRLRGSMEYALSIVRCWHADLRRLEDCYPRLGSVPTLLIWGDRDSAVLPDSAPRVQQAIPGSQLVMLPGVGHLPYEESPEEFNPVLLDFLQRE